MNSRILVAGATGIIGFEVARLFYSRQRSFRTLSQSKVNAKKLQPYAADIRVADATEPEALREICNDIDVVISCLGASAIPANRSRKSYFSIDYLANLNLLEAAKASGVRRFVYVSVFTQPGYIQTDYIQAHEAFIDALKSSGLSYTVIRPTGIFASLGEFVKLAGNGIIPLFGTGDAKSNPVHEADVALACCNAVDEGAAEINIGGPEVLTRKEIGGMAFASVGKHARYVYVPRGLMLFAATLLRVVHRRYGELFDFVARVSTTDCVAPAVGTRRLGDYYAELAKPSSEPTLG